MTLKKKSNIRMVGDSCYIHLPRDLKNDSQFPFEKSEVMIEIVGDKLIISKL